MPVPVPWRMRTRLDSHQDSVVDKVSDCLYGFVSSHTSDVDVLFEIQAFFVHLVLRFATYKSRFCYRIVGLGGFRTFQTLAFDIGFH